MYQYLVVIHVDQPSPSLAVHSASVRPPTVCFSSSSHQCFSRYFQLSSFSVHFIRCEPLPLHSVSGTLLLETASTRH